jgi:hypothetical protein
MSEIVRVLVFREDLDRLQALIASGDTAEARWAAYNMVRYSVATIEGEPIEQKAPTHD